MTRTFPFLLTLSLLGGIFLSLPRSVSAEEDPFAGLSKEILVPESPYLFVNSVTLNNGYRQDHLEPGLGAAELDLYELGLEADLHWGKINALTSLDAGWDSSQDAESLDFLAGLGYDFDLTVTGIQLTPMAGYSTHHLDQDARFDTEWHGPFAGARLDLPLAEKWLLQASYFYHWADFEADLLTAAPASARNQADADGHTARLDLMHSLTDRLDLKLGAEYQSFSSEPASFSSSEAEWDSWSVKLGLSLKF